MADRRPDPDALLRGIQSESSAQGRGRLKVFLGASAGVGKTFAMLSEAKEQSARGVDVVIGYVETHGRAETQALVEGLELIPRLGVEYRGVQVEEFDLDGALRRQPSLILVDELAHTNAPGSRHPKRWQDVEELLNAGINVYTAVNVQHLESLNDAVAQISGVRVRETVPDLVLQSADEIKVVDIPPDDLRQRLREGKVYVPDRIEHALEGFFRPATLHALRELALRKAADRVDEQMRALRDSAGEAAVWHARERILVCIAPSPVASRVVRAAARMAGASHAEVSAVYVESERQEGKHASRQEHVRQALRLAERLGMQTASLAGSDIAGEILDYARKQNANLIVVGKPIRPRWREILSGSVVDELVRRSGEIDVRVVSEKSEERSPRGRVPTPAKVTTKSLLASAGVVAVSVALAALLDHFDASDANLVMPLLLGVAFVASRYGQVEAVLVTMLSVLAFNFLFVDPRFTFAVTDTQYLLTFAVMLAVAMLISTLAFRLRSTADTASERERRTSALYTLSRQLAQSRSKVDLANAAKQEIEALFDGDVAIFERAEPECTVLAKSSSGFEDQPNERASAAWSCRNSLPAGKGTDTLAGVEALYLPLVGGQGSVGALGFLPNARGWPLSPTQRNLMETFANSLGLALERAQLAKESHESRVTAESERLRNALLSSISHDLRTPLTSISGAASALIAQGGGDLAETIYHESVRLNMQVQKLLDMTRLQSGEVKLHLEWHVLQEIVGGALARCREVLKNHVVVVDIPNDLPLLEVDGDLMDKLFTNLLENAAQHTPPGTEIRITAAEQTNIVRVIVSDNGPGIRKGEEVAVFERFARGGEPGKGLGLGLAICRVIARLHKAVIWVRNGKDGGAEFHLELPRPKTQPEIPHD